MSALPANFQEAFDLYVDTLMQANRLYDANAPELSKLAVENLYAEILFQKGVSILKISLEDSGHKIHIEANPAPGEENNAAGESRTYSDANFSKANKDLLSAVHARYITNRAQVSEKRKAKAILTLAAPETPELATPPSAREPLVTTRRKTGENSSLDEPIEISEYEASQGQGADIAAAAQADADIERQTRAARSAPAGALQPPPAESANYNIKLVDPQSGVTLKTAPSMDIDEVVFSSAESLTQLIKAFFDDEYDVVEVIAIGRPVSPTSNNVTPSAESQAAAAVQTSVPISGPAQSSPASPTVMPQLPGTEGQTTESFLEEIERIGLFFGEGGISRLPSPPSDGDPDDPDAPPPVPRPTSKLLGKKLAANLKGAFKVPSMPPVDNNKDEDEKNAIADMSGQDNESLVGKKAPDGFKAAIDLRGMSRSNLKKAQAAENSGLLHRPRLEAVPDYKAAGKDFILSNQNNAWIVLGRDRPGSLGTGYGPGQGHTQAGAIDLVVGRMSPHVRRYDREGHKIRVSPIFNYATSPDGQQVCDAARIYMAQKTDIDRNFGLAMGEIGTEDARSAVGIKADAVRVISRDGGIKLVTMGAGLKNSQGGSSASIGGGVDIIAGNDDENLQPMVLGDNLVELLELHEDALSEIVGILQSVIMNLLTMETALLGHHHMSVGALGTPCTPDPSVIAASIPGMFHLASTDTFSAFAADWNTISAELGYLTYASPNFILSSYNNVN